MKVEPNLKIRIIIAYSDVPNKRVGWNKHVGWKFSQKLINVLFLINMLVGNFEVSINAN